MAKQNIDDQVVLNQFPDAVVVFFNLDDKGLPIRDVADAIRVPDIDDIRSISLTMGSTGTIGQFRLSINNNNNKYFIPDDMELEIDHLKAGRIEVAVRAEGSVIYNTLPPGVTWETAADFLNRFAYDKIRNEKDAPVLYLYFIDTTNNYDDNAITNLKTRETIKNELRRGVLSYRVISETELAEFAKGNAFSSTHQAASTDITIGQAKVAYKKKVIEHQEQLEKADNLQNSVNNLMREKAEIEEAFNTDTSNSIEGTSSASSTKDTAPLSSGQQDTGEAAPDHSIIKAVPLEEAVNIFENAKPQSMFFEEFGGQMTHGRCMFEPMQLCVIFMSRRYRDAESDMTVAFTGYVDYVEDGFDKTDQVLNITGSDVTKIMNVTQANINPSLWTQKLPGDSQFKIWQTRFGGLEGWEIIKLLTIGGELDDDQGNIHGTGSFEFNAIATSGVSDFSSIFDSTISVTELLDGINRTDDEIVGEVPDRMERLFFTPKKVNIQVLPFDTRPVGDFQDYTVFKKIFGMSFGNWQNDYQTHLEIANQVARLTNYEFYADANGEIWYHQPRFNNYHLLTHSNPEIYVLRDEDILNCNLTESDEQVITSVYVVGAPNFYTGPKEVAKMVGFYEDPSLVLKYGRRMVTTSHPYVVSEGDINFFARSYMVRANAGRYVGKVTIIGRPEIRVHMPVYIPYRNMVYYVEGIQHNFVMGDQFTTVLTLRYGRKPWEVLPEILDYTGRANPVQSAQAGPKDVHKATITEAEAAAAAATMATSVTQANTSNADQAPLGGPIRLDGPTRSIPKL